MELSAAAENVRRTGRMKDQEQRHPFRYGQQVRIITCPEHHPKHVGQVGTVTQQYRVTSGIRVAVGTGICRAAAVEAVAEETPADGVDAPVIVDRHGPMYGAPAWWFRRTPTAQRDMAENASKHT
jgi:hypothetical protein